MGQVAAFFDIDGTLYREGLLTEVFKKLIRYEIIDSKRWHLEVKPDYDRWDKRTGNYDDYLQGMADIYVEAIRGLHQSQIDYIAKKVVEQKGDRVYTYTRDRIVDHRKRGHLLITVSGSPRELVEEMAHKHGFDDYVGTIYEKKEGVYTGKVYPMWDAEHKKEALTRLKERYQIDLDASYAYGDTMGDYSMLSMVGHPTIVNATREVYQQLAKDPDLSQRINIIVERKDMVYRLKADQILPAEKGW